LSRIADLFGPIKSFGNFRITLHKHSRTSTKNWRFTKLPAAQPAGSRSNTAVRDLGKPHLSAPGARQLHLDTSSGFLSLLLREEDAHSLFAVAHDIVHRISADVAGVQMLMHPQLRRRSQFPVDKLPESFIRALVHIAPLTVCHYWVKVKPRKTSQDRWYLIEHLPQAINSGNSPFARECYYTLILLVVSFAED
jgi:hypothetical protein